jgi:hypothetical protein
MTLKESDRILTETKEKPEKITRSKSKDWTVMVYLAGDNNLSEEMVTALTGMKNAMKISDSDKKINLVAVYDSGYPTVRIKHYKFTNKNSGGALKECEVEEAKRPCIEQSLEETASISDFVKWAAKNWQAKNYALILSGHSDGIIGRTMFQDSNPSTALHLKKLKFILKEAQSNLVGAKKFALVGFDSCLMNMAEVGYELKDIADVIVASQGNVPTSGWSYFEIVDALVNKIQTPGAELTTQTFAKLIVEKFTDFSENYNVGGRSVNISACDLTRAEDLRKSVNRLAAAFNKILDAPITPVKEEEKDEYRVNALIIEKLKTLIQTSHYYSQTFLYEQGVDLADFATTLSSNCDLAEKEIELFCGGKPKTAAARKLSGKLADIKTKCAAVAAEVDRYVLANGLSGSEYQFSSGVSIFFPWSLLALYMVYGRYEDLSFSRRSAWFKFIESFTKLTYRATDEPLFRNDFDFLEWKERVVAVNKDVSAKDVSAKDVSAKDVSAKDVSAKSESDNFYRFFKRFRNHPINHEVVRKDIKSPYHRFIK